MTTENKYFCELALNLQREGFAVGPEADGLLPVELDGQHLCVAPERGGIRDTKEDVVTEAQTAALDKVTDISGVTAEYKRQMETVPFLNPSSWWRFTAVSMKHWRASTPSQRSGRSSWSPLPSRLS